MDRLLFDRATGALGPNVFARLETTRLLQSFQRAPQFRFNGSSVPFKGDVKEDLLAHEAGVNAMVLDRFQGNTLISGGGDGSIKIWDLEQCGNIHDHHTYQPSAHIPPRSTSAPDGHKFGITNLSFLPFDTEGFLSSSYDQSVSLWSTDSAQIAGTWDLSSKVYTHAISPISGKMLVACGLANPTIRIIDLRSSAAALSLVTPKQIASKGAALSLAWSPRHEHVLASGTLDGAVHIWDVRNARGLLRGMLDQEDSVGSEAAMRVSAKAHAGPVNALTWTDDGAYIVTGAHDARIRVWDAATGANTLASFGPKIRNSQLSHVPMFVTPTGLMPPRQELLFWPNGPEILVMELHEGTTVACLRGPGAQTATSGGGSRRNNRASSSDRRRDLITSVVWRGAGGYGGSGSIGHVPGGGNAAAAVYGGLVDGRICAWMPKDPGDSAEDVVTEDPERVAQGKKRKAIDNAFHSLMGTGISFT